MVRAKSYKNNLRQVLRPYVYRDVCHPIVGYAPGSASLCLLYICGYRTLNNATPFFFVYRGLGLRPYEKTEEWINTYNAWSAKLEVATRINDTKKREGPPGEQKHWIERHTRTKQTESDRRQGTHARLSITFGRGGKKEAGAEIHVVGSAP